MFAITGILGVVAGACSASQAVSLPPVVTSGQASADADEKAAFTDGHISLAEYQAGFASWSACAAKVGGAVQIEETDPSSGLIRYRVYSDNAVGNPLEDPSNPVGQCYRQHFMDIEIAFSANDPAVLASEREKDIAFYTDVMQPCLKANGVESKTVAEPGTDEYVRVSNAWADLNQQGKC
jgi:hypothetical protein